MKMNKKGFTLVELLAVIVILAIVVGISIPSVTGMINNSKNDAMGTALDAAEKFFSEQYSLMNIDYANANADFKTTFSAVTLPATGWTTAKPITGNLLVATGIKSADVTTLTVKFNSSGAACVEATKIPPTSKYYTTKYWKSDGSALTGAKNKSKSC